MAGKKREDVCEEDVTGLKYLALPFLGAKPEKYDLQAADDLA